VDTVNVEPPRRPRIAVVHDLLRGGALTRVRHQLPHLDADVVEFTLTSATTVTDHPVRVPYAERAAERDGLARAVERHRDHARLLRAWRRLAAAVDAADVDAVLAGPCQFLQAPTALRWTRAPSVYFCDEPRRVDYDPAVRATISPRTRLAYAPLRRARRAADRSAVRAATTLATNSTFTAAAIERAYGRTAVRVPLGVDGAFRGEPRDAGRHLLSCGALVATKGHELVIDAAARTRTRRPVVVVAPRGAPDRERALRERAAAAGVALDLRIGIPTAELVGLLRDAHAVLYLAAAEPLGLVSLEAQACGAPVVVADEGGLPETIRAGETGWAVPRHADAAAAAVDRLDDPEVRRRAAGAAIGWASTWTWQRSAAELGRLLDGVRRA
jgi:glycosyltransferase involved in cell wall biosynthesis